MSAAKRDVYAVVTEKMVALLEAGVNPWRKPWRGVGITGKGRSNAPGNYMSGRSYRGVNPWLLHGTALQFGFASRWWLTEKQAAKLGGSLKDGERDRGTIIVYWNTFEKLQDDGTKKKIWFLKYSRVWNLEQAENVREIAGRNPIPEIVAEPVVEPTEAETVEAAEKIAEEYRVRSSVGLVWGGGLACYAPAMDRITMPARETFEKMGEMYSTLFHEMVHSTGSKTRLDRLTPSFFGSEKYSQEELVAEMGAAFLCAEAGILHETADNSASYLQGWINALKGDHKMIYNAAKAAEQAARYMLTGEVEAEQEKDETPEDCKFTPKTVAA